MESNTSLSRNSNDVEDRRVGLIYDERMCKHYALDEEDHPECPGRIRAIWDRLNSSGLAKRCVILNAKDAEDKHLALVHTKSHIDLIKNISSRNSNSKRRKIAAKLNSIYFNEGSSEAAYLAAGSVIEVTEKVAKGELDSAFAIVRPPGHHAEHNKPMGFCLHNNVAIATSYILNEKSELGIKKILIVDWDVHHGNGTQNMFYNDPRVLFFSVHRFDSGTFYPSGHEGSYIMTGEEPGGGYNINVPWDSGGCGDADYVAVWDQILVHVAKEFNPDLIMISAGFDAAVGDPLGGCLVSPYGFSALLQKLLDFAGGKIVMALEGGYNLNSTANSAHACVEVLLQGKPIAGSLQAFPFESTWRVIKEVRQELSTYWPSLAEKLPENVTNRTSPIEKDPWTSDGRVGILLASHLSKDDRHLKKLNTDLARDATRLFCPPKHLYNTYPAPFTHVYEDRPQMEMPRFVSRIIDRLSSSTHPKISKYRSSGSEMLQDAPMTDVVPSLWLPPSGSSSLQQIKLEGVKKRKNALEAPIVITESPPMASKLDEQSIFGINQESHALLSQANPSAPPAILTFLASKGPVNPVETPGVPVGRAMDAIGRCWTRELNDLVDQGDHTASLASLLVSQTAVAVVAVNEQLEKLKVEVNSLRASSKDQDQKMKKIMEAYEAASGDRDQLKVVADARKVENERLRAEEAKALKALKEKEEMMEQTHNSFARELQAQRVKETQSQSALASKNDEFLQAMKRISFLETKLDSPVYNPRILSELVYVLSFVDLIRKFSKEKNSVVASAVLAALKEHMKDRVLDARLPQPFKDLETELGIDMKWWPGYEHLTLLGEKKKVEEKEESEEDSEDLVGDGPEGMSKDPQVPTPGDVIST